jgi:hypothetical protein
VLIFLYLATQLTKRGDLNGIYRISECMEIMKALQNISRVVTVHVQVLEGIVMLIQFI